MAGAGTDEDALIETFCSLSNSEINTIKMAYQRSKLYFNNRDSLSDINVHLFTPINYKAYGTNLETDLMSETSGHFKRLLVSLCSGNRDESGRVNLEAAKQDANALYQAGELVVGTDESTFNMILCQRNYQQLQLVSGNDFAVK